MSSNLYSQLPEAFLEGAPQVGDPNTYLTNLLQRELPRSESQGFKEELKYKFFLDKHSGKKKAKPPRKKKTFLTRNERKKLNILKLPKTDWDYDSLSGLRDMWRQYMRQNLDLADKTPNCCDAEWGNFSIVLARSELIGSEMKIVRSRVPSQVGMSGTVVLETKMTFQIVTPKSQLKIIPKSTSVFEFVLDKLKFTVFGKHIMTRPTERSVKKIKSQMFPDL